jgi:Mn2+/Fe2+ NRAMP family transporter
VHAQESTSTTNTVATTNLSTKMNEWREIGEQISKIATLLLWPFVTVAGIAMDNQMVYGETFGFDSALWKIRNIAKNIANFTLGFYFVYRLFLIIVKGKAEEIKKTIQHTLIAGILIQASRFITAAAVDISTIATYAIGGMPLSVMGETEHSSKYIL